MAGELTDKQRRAIGALLTQRTAQDAASRAGVSERTIRRWLEDSTFRSAYAEASRQRLGETIGRLRAVAADAVDTLRAALTDEHTGHRIRAAMALLDTAVKVEVDDLNRRVEVLEAAQKADQR